MFTIIISFCKRRLVLHQIVVDDVMYSINHLLTNNWQIYILICYTCKDKATNKCKMDSKNGKGN